MTPPPSAEERSRVLLIGAGLMGRHHGLALRRLGHKIVGVVDSDADRATLLARAIGLPVTATNLDSVDFATIDIAHVCTPLDSHAEMIDALLRRQVHVLVEKPLAHDAAATRSLLATAREAGVLLAPVHQMLYQPGVQDAVRLLPSLAPVRQIDFATCSAGAREGGAALADRVAADILPHPLALFERILPRALATASWSLQRPGAGELRCQSVVRGAGLSIMVSMHGRPTMCTLRIVGDGGTVHLDLFHGFGVLESSRVSRARKILHPFLTSVATLTAATGNLAGRVMRREPAYPGLRELIRLFHAAVHGQGALPVSGDETLAVAAARDAILGGTAASSPRGD